MTADDTAVFPVNDKEILRYAGCITGKSGFATDVRAQMADDGARDTLMRELERVKQELEGAFTYSVCYMICDITWQDGRPILPFECRSKDLAKCLKGCGSVMMMAATVGPELDRHVLRAEKLSPTRALLMHAYGAERVEALCDGFCDELEAELSAEGLKLTPRFSPGYGDLSLEVQKDFFRLLDISHLLGISLGDSLLMRPSKSVTALAGIGCRAD